MLYTIGHSSVEIEYFISILKKYHINILCDVRTVPYSSWVPHFNKEYLTKFCLQGGIKYVHREKLGSKYIYPMLSISDEIYDILQKIALSSKNINICLMSDGWNYEGCHRTILSNWIKQYFEVSALFINIKDGSLFTNKSSQIDLF